MLGRPAELARWRPSLSRERQAGSQGGVAVRSESGDESDRSVVSRCARAVAAVTLWFQPAGRLVSRADDVV